MPLAMSFSAALSVNMTCVACAEVKFETVPNVFQNTFVRRVTQTRFVTGVGREPKSSLGHVHHVTTPSAPAAARRSRYGVPSSTNLSGTHVSSSTACSATIKKTNVWCSLSALNGGNQLKKNGGLASNAQDLTVTSKFALSVVSTQKFLKIAKDTL